ncbi:two-component response regulator [Pseudomonas aeruginosa]|nr:two-component response regulator [Pseudomonas aeruginosa]
MSPFAPFDAQTQVLLIDDDPHLRQALRQTLDLAGLKVATLDDARQLDRAVQGLARGGGQRHPHARDGMELLRQLHEQDADLPVILITGHGDVPLAVQAMRGGAYDFLEKPFPSDALLDSVRRALEVRRLVLENRTLRLALAERHELHGRLIGRSAGMQRLREQVGSLAAIQADVLVLGETGAGKEVVARALHDLSSRRDGPSSRSTPAPSPNRWWKANCSVTRPAPSPARRSAASASSSTPMAAPCSSTRSRA